LNSARKCLCICDVSVLGKLKCIPLFLCAASFAQDSGVDIFKSANCESCHTQVLSVCKGTPKGKHHFYANREISAEFDDTAFEPAQSVKYFDEEYKFYKDAGVFKIDYIQGGRTATYAPDMVIGVTPLRQFLIKGQRGMWQTLSMAFDPNKKEFFEVFGDENRRPDEWGHWTQRGMVWNTSCAYCHMTHFKKNYDVKTDSFKSLWLEQGIKCAQCHAEVPEQCLKPQEGGKKQKDAAMQGAKFAKRPSPAARMDSCASCHSRREQLTNDSFKVGNSYFDHFRPTLPDVAGIYRPDGQVMQEDFMFGSFMMCRQYLAGITCANCHDPHSLRLAAPAETNRLCLNCHAPAAKNFKGAPTIDVKAHTRHDERGGDKCIECHMPKTVYMGRDSRFDHGFTSPDPHLTKLIGVPNACTSCHAKIDKDKPERTLDWMISKFDERHSTDRLKRKRERALAVQDSYDNKLGIAHKDALLKLAKSEEIAAWKSVLLNLLAPYAAEEDVLQYAALSLKDPSPLVRSAAVKVLGQLQGADSVLKPMLKDPSRLVRLDASYAMPSQCDAANKAELLEYLDFNADSPLGALRRADYAVKIDNFEDAASFAASAVGMDKTSAELRIESAIILFRAGKADEAKKAFAQAQKLAPQNMRAFYAAGLFYAEIKDLKSCAANFKRALEIDPQFSRGWYNLAIAYLQLGDFESAANAIAKAAELEPRNAEYKQAQNYILSQSPHPLR